MTTPPNYVWLREHAIADTAEAVKGSRRYDGRIYVGAMRSGGSGDGDFILPSVEPWPYVTDNNGVSYPAGIVGTRFRYYFNTTADRDGSKLVAVPSTLPVGYTARIDRDYKWRPGYSLNRGQAAPVFSIGAAHTGRYINQGAGRLRLPGGLHDYLWLPENQGQNCCDIFPSYALVWSEASVGIRYIRYWIPVLSGGTGDPAHWRGRISKNTDGTRGTDGLLGTFGGTLLDDWTFDTTVGFDRGDGWAGDSGVRTVNLESPLGQRQHYCLSIEVSLDGVSWGPFNARIQAGPRLDIPFPFTAAGWTPDGGNQCAPGGYVAGALDVGLP